MKKQMLRKSLCFLSLLFLTGGTPQLFGCAGPTVVWNNRSDTGCSSTNPGISGDFIDQNIDVQGINAIADYVSIQAVTCDVTVSITSGDTVITGSGNLCNGSLANPARLYLYAAAGRSITFDVQDDLIFRGSANGADALDLMVTVSGAGQVVFELSDGTTVSFTEDGIGGGATNVLVGMSDTNQPTLLFVRNDQTSAGDVNVTVGPNSQMSFISPTAVTGLGTIVFDPSNTGAGQMFLNLQDCSSFNIAGHELTTSLNSLFVFGDINFFNVVGLPNVQIVNGAGAPASAYLRVVNGNICSAACIPLRSDPFCDGGFDGSQSGFILGPNATLTLDDSTYLDYIGTATNSCCTFTQDDSCDVPQTFSRLRNNSAFIVDSVDGLTTATILFNGNAAVYFRSGVDKCGNVPEGYIVSPELRTPCAGNIVLSVEGPLDVVQALPGAESGLNILSLEVNQTGCPVWVGGTGASVFPARTFATDVNGEYLAYNKGCFLVNNRMNFFGSALMHTDEIHNVYANNTLGQGLNSEPTYVGGDTYWLCDRPVAKPTVAFYNGQFQVNTDVAAYGVDWRVPNDPFNDNESQFVFYTNGFCIDQGYGRNMILGTGSCFDCCITTTNNSSHIDVFQEVAQDESTIQSLVFATSQNDSCITEGITGDISGQPAVHTVFLNNASNISIGTPAAQGTDIDGNTFPLTTIPTVIVEGSCFSFGSAGGKAKSPKLSGITGQGGIFVDNQGIFTLAPSVIANFGAMVTKSFNGQVNLPENQAFFQPELGISQWKVDLNDPAQRILVDDNQSLSDYTFDWGSTTKSYCCTVTQTDCFVPYTTGLIPEPCQCPAVTDANLTNLPTVRGSVQQFQVLRSRICDTAHILFDNCYIRELVFLPGGANAVAPTGFLVLTNNASVGIGSAHKNTDSLKASVVLGMNGLILCPDGDATIVLNEDVIINNVCPIVTGTNFGANSEIDNTLNIVSITPKKLIIKSTGVLDLGQFDAPNKVLTFGGDIQLVAEPGAQIVMNGGVMVFNENAQWIFSPVMDPNLLGGSSTADLDSVRVKLSGVGLVRFEDDASMFVGKDSFFGIETTDCSATTSIQFVLNDQSSLQIGSEEKPGGSFQVGNTSTGVNQFVNFSMTLDGVGALFQIDRQGFFGMGVGMANKASTIPNQWLVSCLSNIDSMTVAINEGTFRHDQIVTNDSALGSLFAIGTQGNYSFSFDEASSVILGGGNLVKINCTQIEDQVVPTSVTPTVTTFAGTHTNGFVTSNIMSGELLLVDPTKPAQPVGVTSTAFFNYLACTPVLTQALQRANIATEQLNISTLGYITNLVASSPLINRADISSVYGRGDVPVSHAHSLAVGAVHATLDTANQNLIMAQELEEGGSF